NALAEAPEFEVTEGKARVWDSMQPTQAAVEDGVVGFFFSASLDPSRLLSFPTRRSSDLYAAPDFGEPSPMANSQVVGTGDLRIGDRKSTRLNSSHVAISYAGFCLKKKNTPGGRPTACAVTASRLPHPPKGMA